MSGEDLLALYPVAGRARRQFYTRRASSRRPCRRGRRRIMSPIGASEIRKRQNWTDACTHATTCACFAGFGYLIKARPRGAELERVTIHRLEPATPCRTSESAPRPLRPSASRRIRRPRRRVGALAPARTSGSRPSRSPTGIGRDRHAAQAPNSSAATAAEATPRCLQARRKARSSRTTTALGSETPVFESESPRLPSRAERSLSPLRYPRSRRE